MITKYLRIEAILLVALLASILSLAAAYVAQYGFGLKPCELCLMQRVPYVLVIVMAFLGLWKPRHGQWLLVLVGIAFLAGSGIASYHAAVEKQWIKGPSSCTDTEAHDVQSLDDFLKKMQQAPIVACDQPQWDFHRITMAGMNAVWSLLLAVIVLVSLQRKRKPHA